MPTGATELPSGLAVHMVKAGEKLNPTGKNGDPSMRRISRELKTALFEFGDEQCDAPGFAGMTWREAVVLTLYRLAVAGEQWAVRELHNRMHGRVPMNVDARVTMQSDHDNLSSEELAARAQRLAEMARRMTTTIDATVVSESAGFNPLDAGGNPVGDQPSVDGDTPAPAPVWPDLDENGDPR